MAHGFVRKEPFDECALRIDERFPGLEKRFDDLRTLMVVMYTPLAIAILGALVKWIFFPD